MTLSSYITEFREYFDVLHFPHKLVTDTLEEVGLEHRRIGAELGQEQRLGIPAGAYLDLVASMPGTEFVDAADVVIAQRMVKSDEELVYMRRAADITGRARQRLFALHVRPGMTERDVARTLRRLILEEGGDRTSFVHLQLDAPGCKNSFHYDRPLQRGDVLAVDTGAYVGMYTIDYPRMATLGPSTGAQTRAHAQCWRSPEGWPMLCAPDCDARISTASPFRRSPTWAASSTSRTGSRAVGLDTGRACCLPSHLASTPVTIPCWSRAWS